MFGAIGWAQPREPSFEEQVEKLRAADYPDVDWMTWRNVAAFLAGRVRDLEARVAELERRVGDE